MREGYRKAHSKFWGLNQMLLNSITLENIRSYKKQSISFPRGITLFEGDIGSGKSTVLMGIEFALFGLGSIKGSGLLSSKANEGSVKLNFEVNDTPYEIVRKVIKKGESVSQDSKSCYLIEDGVKELLAPTELKQRVLQILRFNEPGEARSESRIYRYAVFTPQEEMKSVLEDLDRRLETIRKAFNLEKYQIAVENASELAQNLGTNIAELRGKFDNLKELDEEKGKISENIEKVNASIQSLKNQRKEETERKTAFEKKHSKLLEKKSYRDEQQVRLENIRIRTNDERSRLESLNQEIYEDNLELEDIAKEILKLRQTKKPTEKPLAIINEEMKKFKKLQNEINGANLQRISALEHIEELSSGLDDFLKSPIPSLEKAVKEYEKSIKDHDEKIERFEQEMKKHEEFKIQNDTQLDEIKKKLSNLDGTDAKCPICETELSAEHIQDLEKKHKRTIMEIENNLQKAKDVISEFSSKIEDAKSDKTKDENHLNEIQNALPSLNKIKSKTFKLEKIDKEIQKLESQNTISEEKNFPNKKGLDIVSYLDTLKDELGNFTGISEKIKGLTKNKETIENRILKSVKKKEKLSSDLQSLKKDHEKMMQETKRFQTLDQDISEAESEKRETDEKVIRLEQSLSEENTNLKHLKQRLEETVQNISRSNQSKEKHDRYSRYQEWIQCFFVSAIRQIETQVLLDIQHRFNETYQNWYSMLIEDPSKESRIDEVFTPVLFQDGYNQDIRNLSGGEKTSIALAYRLTLNSMIRQETDGLKTNLLILDEPTDGFSSLQLTKIRTVLQELHSKQIIIVSHEKELETYVDNIFQVRKDDGISKVSRLGN